MNDLDELRAQLGSFVEQPHIVLELHPTASVMVRVRVHNVGPGVALNVALQLEYVGLAPEDTVTRPITIPALLAGQHYDFYPPFGGYMHVDEPKSFVHKYASVSLTGRATDVARGTVVVRQEVVDLQSWFDNLRLAEFVVEPSVDLHLKQFTRIADHLETLAKLAVDEAAISAWERVQEQLEPDEGATVTEEKPEP
jgi:hypothetical protein